MHGKWSSWRYRNILAVASCVYMTLIHFSAAAPQRRDCSLYEGFDSARCFWGDELTVELTQSPIVWVIEFYSSWCGHCQHFAPTWKETATRIKGWSNVVRCGEIDCSQSENGNVCRGFDVMAYPSIKLVPALTTNPTSAKLQDYVGQRTSSSIVDFILSHLQTTTTNAMATFLNPLDSGLIDESIQCLIFERKDSYIGIKILLDMKKPHNTHIRRVFEDNTDLVKKYSIIHFPTVVFLLPNNKYTLLSGKSAGSDDVTEYFKERISLFLGMPSHYSNQPIQHDQISDSLNPLSGHLVHITRPKLQDIEGAISYSLRMEVRTHHFISDKDFTALLKFVSQLENTFRFYHTSIAHDMRSIRTRLEGKFLAGFILSSEWDRLLDNKLNSDVFPVQPHWSSCAGSEPHYRGYPCALWTLMHTATVLSLSLPSATKYRSPSLQISSREALYNMVNFVKQYFSCERCRKHFVQMSSSLLKHPISYDGDAILWLWEAHNIVNQRLKDEPSIDPAHPKALFPPYQLCPDCYIPVSNKSKSSHVQPTWTNVGFIPAEVTYLPNTASQNEQIPLVYYWNRTAVFLFLVNFYGMDHLNDVSSFSLLNAAWPRQYPLSANQHYPYRISTSYGYANSVIFFVQFVICVLVMAFLISFSIRHNRIWRTQSSLPRYKML